MLHNTNVASKSTVMSLSKPNTALGNVYKVNVKKIFSELIVLLLNMIMIKFHKWPNDILTIVGSLEDR